MKPVAHTAAAKVAAVLSQGKGKADQASLFAKLMAIFAKEIKADATAKGPGKADGKGIAAIDAKALLHHLKDQKGKKQAIAGIVSVIDSKGLPDAAHAAVKGKKGEKHAQQMLAAALQHPQVGSAQHNVADDKIGASGKGASQSALTKGVAETVAKGGSAGGEQPAVADKMSALQGKKPSASAQSESNAKQAQSTTGKTDAHLQQSHDAATQASRHLFSDQNGSGVAVRTASGSGDEVNSGSMPTPGHADPKQTVQSGSQARQATTGSMHPSQAGEKTDAQNMSQAVQSEFRPNGKQSGREKSDGKASADTVRLNAGLHPTGAEAMKRAMAGQVDRNTHPKALQPEAVSHNDSNHNSAIAGGQAQAGRTTLPGGVQAQVMPGHAGDGGSAGATTHSGSPDGGGAGAAGTQSQNGSGNVPFTAHGANTTVASALPKAYAAGAPPAPHTGPWTVMQAMQEVGHQASQGRTRIELKLEPAHLGKIQVFLGSDSKKHIQVHMVVDQAASRQVIAQHLPSLRQTLEQQGLNLGHFSMGSQHQQGGEGAGQQQPGQQHQFADASPDRHGGMDALTPSSIPVSTTMQVTAPGGDSRLSIHI